MRTIKWIITLSKFIIISSWASLVILVLALILILQLTNLAKLSLNLAKLKSLPLFVISSNILDIILFFSTLSKPSRM